MSRDEDLVPGAPWRFTQDDRAAIVADPAAVLLRKAACVVAVRVGHDFIVETDRGPMTGRAGDWLVTNHPEDDPGSDLWSVSDERLKATYVLAEPPPEEE